MEPIGRSPERRLRFFSQPAGHYPSFVLFQCQSPNQNTRNKRNPKILLLRKITTTIMRRITIKTRRKHPENQQKVRKRLNTIQPKFSRKRSPSQELMLPFILLDTTLTIRSLLPLSLVLVCRLPVLQQLSLPTHSFLYHRFRAPRLRILLDLALPFRRPQLLVQRRLLLNRILRHSHTKASLLPPSPLSPSDLHSCLLVSSSSSKLVHALGNEQDRNLPSLSWLIRTQMIDLLILRRRILLSLVAKRDSHRRMVSGR